MSQPSTPNTIQVGSEVITKLDQQPNQPSSAFDRQWTVGNAPKKEVDKEEWMVQLAGC